LRTALRTEPNVRFALLFGSTATGTDTPESDVDVLVDLRNASFERVVDLTTKLTRLVGRLVDVVELKDAESEPSFLAQVVADGRVLVDRENLWPRLRGREGGLRLEEIGRHVPHALPWFCPAFTGYSSARCHAEWVERRIDPICGVVFPNHDSLTLKPSPGRQTSPLEMTP
jgi:predicted nucleotidyltransferase